MLISRLIIIFIILLDCFQIVFMHQIEEQFMINNTRTRLKPSMQHLTHLRTMVASPRQAVSGFTYLAVSLLFQLPLMEIIFVLGLIVLILGIMLHFVELKADFFRLRRQFLRKQRRELEKKREELLRNRTLAASQFSNTNQDGFANQNFNQNFNLNYQNYGNYHRDHLYGQYSDNSYATHRIREPDRQFSRFPPLTLNNFRHQFMNYPNFYRQQITQRYPNYNKFTSFQRQVK